MKGVYNLVPKFFFSFHTWKYYITPTTKKYKYCLTQKEVLEIILKQIKELNIYIDFFPFLHDMTRYK